MRSTDGSGRFIQHTNHGMKAIACDHAVAPSLDGHQEYAFEINPATKRE